MRRPNRTVTLDSDELLAEVLSYAEGIDRTFSNFAVHAMKQYMRRYPKEGQKAPRSGTVVPEAAKAGEDAAQLHAGSPQGKEE